MSQRWRYRPRTREEVERHLAIARWPDAVYQAYKGKTKPLCDYLRRSDLPLDVQQRSALADLIERRIGRKNGKGRKPGTIPRPDDKFTTSDAVAHARGRLKLIRARNGGIAPRGSYKKVLDEVCQYFADEGFPMDVDEDKALAALRRGKPTRR